MSITKVVLALASILLLIKLARWMKQRRRFVEAIEKLPGPPIPFFAPILNHAIIIIYLDSLRHKMGTFTIAYYVLSHMYKLFPDTGISRVWLGWKPIVVLYSPENAECVLSSTTLINKAEEYSVFEPWIGEGLITSKRTKWRFRRKILTPAFHFRILNDFLPVMNQEASKLIKKINQIKYLGQDKVTDLTPLIALCTLDTICETAMGTNINSQENEDSLYVHSLKEVAETALSRVSRPWLWFDFIFYRTDEGKRFIRAKDAMHAFSYKVILERKACWEKQFKSADGTINSNITFDELRESSFFSTGNKRLAFLDLLLHQHLFEKTMTVDDVREEVDTFMFAGHDTTGMSISWTLYMLGLHENIQDKVREELDRVLQPDDEEETFDHLPFSECKLNKKLKTTDINLSHLREMKYLECVIKESLRMWPSVPFVARHLTEDLTVDNKYLIPKGATCMVFTQAMHNNPKYYPKPEMFDPDRFLPENTIGRHPFAYVPFSAGPRNCIGQKFAQMELKVILAKVIRNYFIKTYDQRDKLEIVGELVLRSRNGLNVNLKPRFT